VTAVRGEQGAVPHTGRHHFPLVDSLRGVAALGVLATHVAAPAGLYTGDSFLGQFAARLDVGVAVFFVISGFLLYRPFARAHLEGTPPMRIRAYAWRRLLRIGPAYWVALTAAALVFSVPGILTARGILTYYGLAQSYTEDTIGGGLAQAWTLTIEVAFYAFLPLFALAVRRLARGDRRARMRAEIAAVAGLVVVGFFYKLGVLVAQDSHAVTITPALVALPAYLDQFGLGMLLALLTIALAEGRPLPRALVPLDRRPVIALLVAFAAFVVVSTQLGIDTAFFAEPITPVQYFLRHLLYAVIAVALMLPAVVGDERRGTVRRAMRSRGLLYLGLVSYGIFLWNLLIVNQLGKWGFGSIVGSWPPLVYLCWFAATLAVTLLPASASWFLIERRALSLKRKVATGSPEGGAGREA
jgi:peptidoglycan/LPS O-acetylase OafA/YrhL